MNKSKPIDYFRAKELLPFQADFAVNFIASKDKPYWQLVSPVGTGKTRLTGFMMAYMLEEEAKRRILVLAPAMLLEHWRAELSEMIKSIREDLSPLIIDRKAYLEIESQVPLDENPWPLPAIALMSIDLAKRDDMTKNLSKTIWDLVIFDESHLLTGKRKSLFDYLIKSSVINRALLLTATPSQQPFWNVFTKEINWDEVVDWNGQALYPSFEKKVVNVFFERTGEERAFLNDLEAFSDKLGSLLPHGKFQKSAILRAASSSFYALERGLQRLLVSWRAMRNKLAHSIPLTTEDLETTQHQLTVDIDEVEGLEEILEAIMIPPHEFMALYRKLESLLDRLEEIQTDSKLDSLQFYLKRCSENKCKGYICVWTSFKNTAEYLNSSLQGLGMPVYLLTGSLQSNDIKERILSFKGNAGILIITDVALEGITLEFVDECINYDLPLNPLKFEQRWGRFLRAGRESEFRMVVLRDLSKSLRWEEELLNKLEGTM